MPSHYPTFRQTRPGVCLLPASPTKSVHERPYPHTPTDRIASHRIARHRHRTFSSRLRASVMASTAGSNDRTNCFFRFAADSLAVASSSSPVVAAHGSGYLFFIKNDRKKKDQKKPKEVGWMDGWADGRMGARDMRAHIR